MLSSSLSRRSAALDVDAIALVVARHPRAIRVHERRFEVPGPGSVEVEVGSSSVKRPGKHHFPMETPLRLENLLRFSDLALANGDEVPASNESTSRARGGDTPGANTQAMQCAGFPHFAASPTGHLDMWIEVLRYTIGWAVFFYTVAGAVALLERAGLALQPSTKAHENSVFLLAQAVGCTTKSLIVSLMGIHVVWGHWDEPAQAHFAGSVVGSDLAFMAGMLFGSFEVMDVATSFLHNMLSAVQLTHHSVHIGIGCIMMYNCGPHFLTAVLLAQDFSSVFLNPYLVFRYRYPNHPAVVALYAVFAVAFVVVRIVLGTWGTYYYINHYQEHLVGVDARLFPEWQAHLLAAAIATGSMMQFAFFCQVISNALRMRAAPKSE